VQQEIVKVDPLGSVEWSGRPGRISGGGILLGLVSFERRLVMLVFRAVIRATHTADQRRIHVSHRVVLLRFLGSPTGR
jgi:hypothetical protein